jgi:nucleotide-binding universal stress UspA family protein
MKTIIVPIDFSATALNAARYAADLALHIHASVKLLHVMPLPLLVADVPFPYENYGMSIEEVNKSMDQLKEELHKRTNDKIAISGLVTEGVFETQVKGMLIPGMENWVVMGTSGGGAVNILMFGSFTIFAAKHLSCPVIIVPPGVHYKKIENIGLACDMKNVTETVPFDEIKTICSGFSARLFVLYVSKPDENMYPSVLSETKFMQINLSGIHPDFRIVTHEDASEGLAEFVEKAGIDMLMLIAKERNFVENIFHKSITKSLQAHSSVPVMVLHQP